MSHCDNKVCREIPFGTQAHKKANITPGCLSLVVALSRIGDQVVFSVARIVFKSLQLIRLIETRGGKATAFKTSINKTFQRNTSSVGRKP